MAYVRASRESVKINISINNGVMAYQRGEASAKISMLWQCNQACQPALKRKNSCNGQAASKWRKAAAERAETRLAKRKQRWQRSSAGENTSFCHQRKLWPAFSRGGGSLQPKAKWRR
jgi:hypothetical protein